MAALEATLALNALAEERLEIELRRPRAALLVPAAVRRRAVRAGRDAALRARIAWQQRPAPPSSLGALQGVDAGRREAQTTVGTMPYDALLVAVGAEPTEAIPGALTFRGPADTDQHPGAPRRAGCRGRPPRRLRRSVGRRLVATALRARAHDRGLARSPRRPGRRALDRHARAGAARSSSARPRARQSARFSMSAESRSSRPRMRPSSMTATCCSRGAAGSRRIASSRCRGCAGLASTASRRRSTASSPSMRTDASAAWRTSTPPATSRAFRSSRAASRRSSPTPRRRRSRRGSVPTSFRSRSVRCCAACC